jgi:hypothetical protein
MDGVDCLAALFICLRYRTPSSLDTTSFCFVYEYVLQSSKIENLTSLQDLKFKLSEKSKDFKISKE